MKTPLTTVSDTDFNKILQLTRRKKTLERVAQLSDSYGLADGDIEKDIRDLESRIREWWNEVSLGYGLRIEPGGKWFLDFNSKTIYLTDEEI